MKRLLSIIICIMIMMTLVVTPVSAATKEGLSNNKVKGEYVYLKDGKIDESFTGIATNKSGMWMVNKGKVNFKYTGFGKDQSGVWWYVKNSKVDLKTKGLYKGTVNGKTTWWFVKDGRVSFTNTLAKYKGAWWKINDGCVNYDYTGFTKYKGNWWYVKNGKIDMKTTGLRKGTINGVKTWYKVVKSKFVPETDMVKKGKDYWYVNEGVIDYTLTGYAIDGKGAKWIVKDGKARSDINGIVKLSKNAKTKWVVDRGKILVKAMTMPVERGWISYHYGPRDPWEVGVAGASADHKGMDIACYMGSKITAAEAGTVILSEWHHGYGYAIIVDHGNGIHSLYGHNSQLVGRVGQKVKKGQLLAYSGSTGISSGPHLHFEVRYNGKPKDPRLFLKNLKLKPM